MPSSTIRRSPQKSPVVRPGMGDGNPYSFAYGLNFYKLVWIFAIGCFLGWFVETVFCFVRTGTIECRQGVIYGPFIPIYGMGALLFTVSLYRYRNRSHIVIFLASSIIGAVFEYVCSWVQEKVFGTVSWEYSESALNLHGRTNLYFAVCWGVLGLAFITRILPFLTRFIEQIPNRIGIWLTWIFIGFMVLDLAISAIAVKRQDLRRDGVPASNAFWQFIDEHYNDEYLKRVFPNMEPVEG